MPTSPPANYNVDPEGEFPFAASRYLFYLLFHAARQRDVVFDATAPADSMSLQRLRILAVIRRIENCSMKDLALFTSVDRTTLTRTVDQLVADGLVERWSPARDRRRVNIAINAQGEAMLGAVAEPLIAGNNALLAGLDEASVRTTARVLQHIIRRAMGDPLTAERLLAFGVPASARRP